MRSGGQLGGRTKALDHLRRPRSRFPNTAAIPVSGGPPPRLQASTATLKGPAIVEGAKATRPWKTACEDRNRPTIVSLSALSRQNGGSRLWSSGRGRPGRANALVTSCLDRRRRRSEEKPCDVAPVRPAALPRGRARVSRAALHGEAPDPSALCEPAIVNGARRGGVPAEVLHAVALTETGRKPRRADAAPGPGRSTARARATGSRPARRRWPSPRTSLAEGRTSFDVGCVQINYRWHGHAFPSLDDDVRPGMDRDLRGAVPAHALRGARQLVGGGRRLSLADPGAARRSTARGSTGCWPELEPAALTDAEALVAAARRRRGSARAPGAARGAAARHGRAHPRRRAAAAAGDGRHRRRRSSCRRRGRAARARARRC